MAELQCSRHPADHRRCVASQYIVLRNYLASVAALPRDQEHSQSAPPDVSGDSEAIDEIESLGRASTISPPPPIRSTHSASQQRRAKRGETSFLRYHRKILHRCRSFASKLKSQRSESIHVLESLIGADSQSLTEQTIRRRFLVTNTSNTLVIALSLLPYTSSDVVRDAKLSADAPVGLRPMDFGSTEEDKQSETEVSFGQCFAENNAAQTAVIEGEGATAAEGELLIAFTASVPTQKTTFSFPGLVSVLLPFVDTESSKREVNERFAQSFPHAKVTFTKLQSIKTDMRLIATTCELDNYCLAHAHALFERCVLSGFVDKENRKLVAGAVLLLICKLYDLRRPGLTTLLEQCELVFRLNSKRSMVDYEVPLLASALQFDLSVKESLIKHHYSKLVT